MGKTKLDERGRILIPSNDRKKLGLKPGTEFEVYEEKGLLLLKPLIPEPVRVRSGKRDWGESAFLDAGDATFGE